MIDSLLDFRPDNSFSITRIRVSCSTKNKLKTGAAAEKGQLCVEQSIADAAEKQQQNEEIHSAVLFRAQ